MQTDKERMPKKVKIVFCNKCHKRIVPPAFIDKVNMAGSVKIKCGDNKCSGFTKIKGTSKDEIITHIDPQDEWSDGNGY